MFFCFWEGRRKEDEEKKKKKKLSLFCSRNNNNNKNSGIQRFGYPFMWAGRQITNAIVGADTISFGDAAVIVGAASVSNAGGPWVNGKPFSIFF